MGLSKLRSNFFLERLISAVESVPGMSQAVDCDVCLIGKKCKGSASSFCMECQQSMCDQCSNIHGSMKTIDAIIRCLPSEMFHLERP